MVTLRRFWLLQYYCDMYTTNEGAAHQTSQTWFKLSFKCLYTSFTNLKNRNIVRWIYGKMLPDTTGQRNINTGIRILYIPSTNTQIKSRHHLINSFNKTACSYNRLQYMYFLIKVTFNNNYDSYCACSENYLHSVICR